MMPPDGINTAYDALEQVDLVLPGMQRNVQVLEARRARAAEEIRLRSRILGGMIEGAFDGVTEPGGNALASQAEKEENQFVWQGDARPALSKAMAGSTKMNCQASVEYSQRVAWPEAQFKSYGGPPYPEMTTISDSYRVRSYTLAEVYESDGRLTLKRGDVLTFGADSRDHVAIYLGFGRVKSLFTHNKGRTFVGGLATILEQTADAFYKDDTIMMVMRMTVHRQVVKGG